MWVSAFWGLVLAFLVVGVVSGDGDDDYYSLAAG